MSTIDKAEMGLALWDAIDVAGGTGKLARLLGITTQAVSLWETCPLERVIAVEKLTGVSRFRLRPDHFSVPLTRKPAIKQEQRPRAKATRRRGMTR